MTKIAYRLTYQVQAHSRLNAVMAAGARLRNGVTVDELVDARPFAYGWWEVVFAVTEDPAAGDPVWPGDLPEQADPITAAKADIVRWGP